MVGLDEIIHVIAIRLLGHCAQYPLLVLWTLLQLVVLNACHFGPECHDLRSEHVIIFMKIIVVSDLTCKLYTHIIVRNPRPQSESNWDNMRGWL
jgi:hypothetical protein